MSDRPSIQHLWTNQPTEGFSMSLEEIRGRSAKFQRTVRSRNFREYAAAVVVVAAFGWYVLVLPGVLVKTGSVMLILATLFVVWQLHRRGSPQTLPVGGSVMDQIAFHRGELIRQRDALRSVATWYLAPFVPGLIVFLLGFHFQIQSPRLSVLAPLTVAGAATVVFSLIWAVNRWVAARLQKMIDSLDRVKEGE